MFFFLSESYFTRRWEQCTSFFVPLVEVCPAIGGLWERQSRVLFKFMFLEVSPSPLNSRPKIFHFLIVQFVFFLRVAQDIKSIALERYLNEWFFFATDFMRYLSREKFFYQEKIVLFVLRNIYCFDIFFLLLSDISPHAG